MLIHGWLDKEHRLHVTKYPDAIPELRGVIRNGEPITLESGQRLKAYSAGKPNAPAQAPSPSVTPSDAPVAGATMLDADQCRTLLSYCEQLKVNPQRVFVKINTQFHLNIQTVEQIPAAHYDRCIAFVDAAAKK